MKRESRNEIMDDLSIGGETIELALKELKLINTYLGGNSTTKSGLKTLTKRSINSELTILDAGAGASDILHGFKKKIDRVRIISLDANLAVCNFVKKSDSQSIVVCGDTKALPIKNDSVDIVHSSLFLHHFDEENISVIIQLFSSVAKHRIIINDLRRSHFALMGIKILTSLFSKSKMVKNDAPLSVRRGFKKKELIRIFDRLNLNYTITRKWAFRWLIVVFFSDKKISNERA